VVFVVGLGAVGPGSVRAVRAAAFGGYGLVDHFLFPDGSGPFDVLADGRLITLAGADVYVESAPRSRSFTLLGALPDADIASFGAAFVRVSPDGTRFAVGNNGGTAMSVAVDQALEQAARGGRRDAVRVGSSTMDRAQRARRLLASRAAELAGTGTFEVGVFALSGLSGEWFAAGHFDAEWIDDRHLAIAGGDFGSPAVVTALDTESVDPADPVNPIIIDNIGGASGGVAFDEAGNLFTGNGFSTIGPSGTGVVKAFADSDWMAAMSGGTPPDFENDGTVIVDVLSASPLDFDGEGNLLIGGGDFFGSGEGDFAAIVRSAVVSAALSGSGPADVNDPTNVRRLDPDLSSEFNFYSVRYNEVTGEMYVRDGRVFAYQDVMGVPAASSWGLTVMALAMLAAGTLAVRRTHHFPARAAEAVRS
jgi:hypothetical protein